MLKGNSHTLNAVLYSKTFVRLLIGMATVLLIVCICLVSAAISNDNELIDHQSYQAVQLTDGAVFYGKIQKITNTHLILNDTYYEKTVGAEESKVSLTKHGTEPYQPSGPININRNQILFWENLSRNSIVTKAIKK